MARASPTYLSPRAGEGSRSVQLIARASARHARGEAASLFETAPPVVSSRLAGSSTNVPRRRSRKLGLMVAVRAGRIVTGCEGLRVKSRAKMMREASASSR